jgi:hypothetical protein
MKTPHSTLESAFAQVGMREKAERAAGWAAERRPKTLSFRVKAERNEEPHASTGSGGAELERFK